MKKEISMLELFTIIKNKIWWIITLGLIGLATSLIFSTFIQTEEYYATAKIAVNNSDVHENIQEIVKRPALLEDIQKEFTLDVSDKELADNIEISRQADTSFYTVKVTSKTEGKVTEIVDYITTRFQNDVDEILDIPTYSVDEYQAYEAIQTVEKLAQDTVITEKEATIATESIEARTNLKDTVEVIFESTREKKDSQSTTANLAIGTMLGLMIGIGFVFVHEALDTTVQDEEEIAKEFGWVNLGTIDHTRQAIDFKKKVSHTEISNSIQGIRANISLLKNKQKLESILIASADQSRRALDIAAILAGSFANKETKVLLVDGNLIDPNMHELFGVSNKQGMSDALINNKKSIKEVIYSAETPGLDIMTAGSKLSQSVSLNTSKEIEDLVAELENMYDLVMFTTTSLISDGVGRLLANKVDGTLVIVSKNQTTKENLERSKTLLQLADADVIGSVLDEYTEKG